MIKKVVANFLKNNNINKEDNLILGLSGGVDSMTLFDVLTKLGYHVIIAHVNHHKREESETEEKAIKDMAEALNVPFEKLDFYDDYTDNFHNLAHHARYEFFKKLSIKYHTKYIVTAHHADDQIETILIKILEGSNLYGYGGISKINDDGTFILVRPLLTFSKAELYQYAKVNNLVYFEDSSNSEDHYLRNRIRHQIIPLLKDECPDIYNKIDEYSNQIKEAFSYIRTSSIKYLDENNNKIDLTTFRNFDIALKKDIICLLLERYQIRKNYDTINNIYYFLEDSFGSKKISLEDGYFFYREYHKAYIAKENIQNEEIELILNLDNKVIYKNEYLIYFSKNIPNTNAKYLKLCYNTLKLPFKIRNKKEGDSILLNVGNKKLSRLFIDDKIPKEKRNQLPIILDNNDEILWVYDIAKAKKVFEDKNKGDIYLVVERMNQYDDR